MGTKSFLGLLLLLTVSQAYAGSFTKDRSVEECVELEIKAALKGSAYEKMNVTRVLNFEATRGLFESAPPNTYKFMLEPAEGQVETAHYKGLIIVLVDKYGNDGTACHLDTNASWFGDSVSYCFEVWDEKGENLKLSKASTFKPTHHKVPSWPTGPGIK